MVGHPEQELDFFANPQQEAIKEFMDHLPVPSITEVHQDILNAPIKHLEISKAIDLLKTRQTPVPGGYSTEFYTKFKCISNSLTD